MLMPMRQQFNAHAVATLPLLLLMQLQRHAMLFAAMPLKMPSGGAFHMKRYAITRLRGCADESCAMAALMMLPRLFSIKSLSASAIILLFSC